MAKGQIEIYFPCPDVPQRELRITFPERIFLGPNGAGKAPEARCIACDRSFVMPEFLSHGEVKVINGADYLVLQSDKTCSRCEPRDPIRLVLDKSDHLCLRMELADPRGAQIRWWDASTSEWYDSIELPFRMLHGVAGGVVSAQPYKNRRSYRLNPKPAKADAPDARSDR